MNADHDRILSQLTSFTPENFRKQRWLLIDRARKAGITWEVIGEALGTKSTGAIRMYREFKPEDPA